MYCRQCGAENEDNAVQCVKCGQPLQQPEQPVQPQAPTPKVADNLVWAILVSFFSLISAVFCCVPLGLPFGIASIVFAAQVNGKLQAGDYEGAIKAANSAKMWAWIAFGVTLLIFVIGIALVAIFGIAGGLLEPFRQVL